jgi:predicted nucleic-acid-binding protein
VKLALAIAEIAGRYSALLDPAPVSFEEEPSVERAIYVWKESAAEFADCLINAGNRRLGCGVTATSDCKAKVRRI